MNTTYFKNLVMGNIFKTQTSPAIPAKCYLGLSTTLPSTDGSNVTEPSTSGTGYSRVGLDNLSTPVDGVISSQQAIEFPESTTDWGEISHYVIYDEAIAGNLLMYGPLENTRRVDAKTVVTFASGGLTISLEDVIE